MKKGVLLVLVSFTLLILVACGDGNSADAQENDEVQKMIIRFVHVVSENTPKHQGALAMKEYIEEASDGTIRMEIYPNSSLFGDQDEYQNLVANNIQFIAPALTKFVGNNPQFNISEMPFLFENDEQAIEFWDGEKGQEVLGSLQEDGVLGLSMWPNGGKHLTNNKRAITSPEDLKGLKFRTQGGQLMDMIYSTLKAGSESIPFDELYTALDQGVVDGQENTFSNIESKKFHEVQKYMTVINHTRVDYAVFTNTKFWNSMNDATREIVEEGLAKGTEVARAEALTLNEQALEKIKAAGTTEVNELTAEQVDAFREVLQPVYAKYEEIIGADVIDAALKVSNH